MVAKPTSCQKVKKSTATTKYNQTFRVWLRVKRLPLRTNRIAMNYSFEILRNSAEYILFETGFIIIFVLFLFVCSATRIISDIHRIVMSVNGRKSVLRFVVCLRLLFGIRIIRLLCAVQ